MSIQRLSQLFRARLWLILLITIVTLATTEAFIRVMPREYTSSTTLIIDFEEPQQTDPSLPAILQSNYLTTQIGIIESLNVALRVVDQLGLANRPEWVEKFYEQAQGRGSVREWIAERLRKNLSVLSSSNSRLVTISYSAESPTEAVRIANAFATAYSDISLELTVNPARQSAEWIDLQLAPLRQKLEEAQRRLAAYQQEKGIVGTDERLDVESEHLNALTRQLAEAQAAAGDAQTQLRQLAELTAEGISPDTLPDVVGNTYIQSIRAELQRKQSALADTATSYGSRHPEYRRAAAEVTELRATLRNEINNLVESVKVEAALAESRVSALLEAQAQQKAKLLALRGERDQLAPLMREVESAQRNYDDALQRSQRYDMQSRITQTNVAILNPAVEPRSPSKPTPWQSRSLAVMLGLGLGLGVALMLELRRRTVLTEEDFEGAMDEAVIGTLGRS